MRAGSSSALMLFGSWWILDEKSAGPVQAVPDREAMPLVAGDRVDQRLGALMAKAQAGDRRCYLVVLHFCQRIIFNSAICAGVNEDCVDGVVQQTLVTIHEALGTYDPARSLVAWVEIIARRRAMEVLRRSRLSYRSEPSRWLRRPKLEIGVAVKSPLATVRRRGV